MKLKILFLSLLFIILSCASTGGSTASDDYGYTEKNPVKVGGVNSGPANERAYLDRLTGPKGELIKYHRLGSCCSFKSNNAPFGMGLLDRYEITIEGDSIKKILYLNMYDKGKLYAPKGFLLK